MAGNKNLASAARAKKDKFYTQLEDIENELRHYKDFFAGKVVLCNCDDPYESNFFKYFAVKFNSLKILKLITTSYADSPIIQTELDFYGTKNKNFDKKKDAIMIEATELQDWNGDGRKDLNDVEFAITHGIYNTSILNGDENNFCAGDFRSTEMKNLLKIADVVVTNPPFSLFREYVKQLIDFDKKFLIIGNVNAITYKEIFPLIKNNQIWLGESIHSGDREFRVPDDYPLEAANCRIENGIKYLRIKGVRWYTNIKISKFREDIPLWAKYTPEKYPRYDNYDAIEVSKTAEIPEDYFGVMGVPITFLDKYNPEQFEIIGLDRYTVPKKFLVGGRLAINGKPKYARILIRRRQK